MSRRQPADCSSTPTSPAAFCDPALFTPRRGISFKVLLPARLLPGARNLPPVKADRSLRAGGI
ncbi:hypothetical protein [Kitasatospora phosalacinea]|uniref:Uncharacterized protein n=1 Tax=Kitasatospora phosalacinea TaxID=2065 RepID=A0A9W6USF6_9ACTN|nr:hypothetical protein [Kitasatospora phosalacinea]GLW58543.1 hypothetical protein Kpho01_65540 [Kitasatospora phosalacinea]